ncbi:MAG: T9SS type A sorting domain-containing protein [Bacteroidota bacterium]
MFSREIFVLPLFILLFPFSLFTQNIWIEAECGTWTQQWENTSDSLPESLDAVQALGPDFINNPTSDGNRILRYEIDAPEDGNYFAFARVKAIDPASNSLWMRVNGGAWVPWEDIKLSPMDQPTPNAPLPVIPGGQGYGIHTPAGRGGQIIKVTNLNDGGPGSLRACVQASGPRVCVFEVSGFINLNSPLSIKNPYLTIAGQTAPAPGILLGKGHGIQVWTNDVLIQHIGVRPGDGPGTDYRNRDGLQINGTAGRVGNVVIDHVSLAWGMDENLDLWGLIGDVTINNCIIAQAMRDPFEIDGQPSYGNLIGPYDNQTRVAIMGSYYAGNRDRQPLSRSPELIFANNMLYDRVLRFVYLSNRNAFGSGGFPTNSTVVGNAFIEGPDMSYNLPHERPVTFDKNGQLTSSKLYMDANWWSEVSYSNQWNYVKDANSAIQSSTPAAWINGFQYETDHQKVMNYVKSQAGARPLDRNYLDQALFDHLENETKAVVTCVTGCQQSAGGWPVLASQYRTLDLPDNPSGDDDGDGYTNLEEWLHAFARGVETGKGSYIWDQVRDANHNNSPVSFSLNAGNNVIEIAVREQGLGIDKFYFSKLADIPANVGLTGFACDTIINNGQSCYLPNDWLNGDIGSVGFSGSACYDSVSGVFSFSASGADIWGTEDAFQYAFKPMVNGADLQIQTRVTSLDSTDAWAKAGVMIRTGIDPDAANVMLYTSAEGRWSFQRRTQNGGSTISTKSGPGAISLPYWVRLVKSGNKVYGEVSSDGQSWTKVEETTLNFGPNYYAGLAVTSHANQTLTYATFDNVSMGLPGNEQTFPVELLAFDAVAEPIQGRVRINWSTAQEENNNFFTIERSVDGTAFVPIGRLNSQGSGTVKRDYLWYDEQPLQGAAYYRLKQTDLDGTFQTFSPVLLTFETVDELKARFYPNPVGQSEQLTADVWTEGTERLLFQVYNQVGQLVKVVEKHNVLAGWQVYKLDVEGLGPGLYMIKLSHSANRNSRFATHQLLIQ